MKRLLEIKGDVEVDKFTISQGAAFSETFEKDKSPFLLDADVAASVLRSHGGYFNEVEVPDFTPEGLKGKTGAEMKVLAEVFEVDLGDAKKVADIREVLIESAQETAQEESQDDSEDSSENTDSNDSASDSESSESSETNAAETGENADSGDTETGEPGEDEEPDQD